MEPPSEMSVNDVDELAKIRVFNVGRTQLLDLMHDLTTPGKGENIEIRRTNGARGGGPAESNNTVIRHGSGGGVKERSRNHESRASSNPLRNSKTGALSFSGKNFNSSLRTSERVATPLYNSGSKSSSNVSQHFTDTTVNRGKVLDFTKEQEKEKMRAEIALHHPRIPPPHQDRSQCTIPNTSSHLNLLAQPKRLPTESVKDSFETHPSGGHRLSATQWTSPLTSSLVLHKTEMENSGHHSTDEEQVPKNQNEKFSCPPSGNEKKRIELLAPPPRRSLAHNSPSLSSSVPRRHTSSSMIPERFRGAKAHSPPVRPFTRHAHSCGPPQRAVPGVHSGGHSEAGGGGGGALPSATFSVHSTTTVSRSFRSMSSLLHITPSVAASTTRFSGVSQISKPITVLAPPPTNIQSTSKVQEASWDKLPSKSEQVARRKFIHEVSQRGSSIKADRCEERVIISNNRNHNNNMVNSKESTENNGRSFCEVTNSSFLSSSSYSAASSLLEVPEIKKPPTDSPQQHQNLHRNGAILGTITPPSCGNESGIEETRLSDVHSLPQFPIHFERNGASFCEAVSSSNRALCSRSDVRAITSRTDSHSCQPLHLVEKREGETHEMKDPVIKRIKKGCPKELCDNDGSLRNPGVRNIMVVSSSTRNELKDGPLSVSDFGGGASSASADARDSEDEKGVKMKNKDEEQMGVSLSGNTEEVRGAPPGCHLDPVGQKVEHHCPRYSALEDSGCEENTSRNVERKKMETSVMKGAMEVQSIPKWGNKVVKSQPAPSLEEKDEDMEDVIPDPPMRVMARRSRREAASWPPPDMASSNDENEEDIHYSTRSLLSRGNEGILSSSLFHDGVSDNGSAAVVVVKRRSGKKKS